MYDVNASLPVLLEDVTRKYVWGLGLAFAVDASGSPIVYHTDGLGSVRALTDPSGTVVQSYLYDEYGNVTSSTGSITQPYQYTGEVRDAETGFIYLRARQYDPTSGRFASRDGYPGSSLSPQSLNRYGYVEGNPINATDPSGNNPLVATCAAGALLNVAIDLAVDLYQGEKITGSQVLQSAGEGCIGGLTAFGAARIIGKLAVPALKILPTIDRAGPVRVRSAVEANKAQGDAFRDFLADELRDAGRDVGTEVTKRTPFGIRRIDIEVRDGEKILGGIETKTGASRYTPSQRAKDMYLKIFEDYPVNIARLP